MTGERLVLRATGARRGAPETGPRRGAARRAASSGRVWLTFAASLLAPWLGCGASPASPSYGLPAAASGPLALVGVNVVPMTGGGDEVLSDRTVLIRDGRIAWIGPSAATLPEDAERIEADGRYLIPGLIDMHVHLSEEDVPAYLAAGVTTVRDMWGWSEVARIREAVRVGTMRGPRVLPASPGVDGSPPARPQSLVVTGTAEVESLVRDFAGDGWTFVKLYQNLSLPVYRALTEAAASAGIAPVGHVPTSVPLELALERQRSIEHLEGYDTALTGSRLPAFGSWATVDGTDEPAMIGLARATAAADVWNCPTLLVATRVAGNNLSAAARDRVVEGRRAMVRALHEEGARILAGTDGGVPVVPAGSIAEELLELTRAGLTPREALRAATADAAEFLELEGEIGRIVEGARADLVLVDSNPIADIRALRRPAGIVLGGEWLRTDAIR